MKVNITILLLFFALTCNAQNVGEKVPKYIFSTILNHDKQPFDVSNQKKPVIIEFWATWCAPCIPAMKKLEGIQQQYGDRLEILTVSTDSHEKLNRYIKNANTTLRIASDTAHLNTFHYKHIPHTILIDKDGYVRAVTTPDRLSDEVIADFVLGKEINLSPIENSYADYTLNKEFKSNEYQFKLTSENKAIGFKNEIKRNENNEAVSLEFSNVSLYRLLTDIYELKSAARIYDGNRLLKNNKYCFQLEQSDTCDKTLLENAKAILNENLDVKAKMVEKTLDSVYVLEILDRSKLPKASTQSEKFYAYHGPDYKGTKISSSDLIEYLENEVYKPVKDKTSLDYDFDIELKWSYELAGTLNEELKKYGLVVKKSPTPETITLLEIKSK